MMPQGVLTPHIRNSLAGLMCHSQELPQPPTASFTRLRKASPERWGAVESIPCRHSGAPRAAESSLCSSSTTKATHQWLSLHEQLWLHTQQ